MIIENLGAMQAEIMVPRCQITVCLIPVRRVSCFGDMSVYLLRFLNIIWCQIVSRLLISLTKTMRSLVEGSEVCAYVMLAGFALL